MKSERRHELEHNVLLAWLDQTISASKPHLNTIFGIALAVVLLVCAVLVWTRLSASSTAGAWTALFDSLGDTEKLGKIAEANKGSEVGQIAACSAADAHLETGCNLLFEDTGRAKTEIRKAIDNYYLVIGNSNDSALRERATFGLARAIEASGENDSLKNALALYLKVAKLWPNGAYAKIAADRASDLAKDSTKEFYDRFAHFQPKARGLSMPGNKPTFDLNNIEPPTQQGKSDLNTTFDFKFDTKKGADEKSKPEGEATDKPADEKKADEKKPDEPKADDTAKPEVPATPDTENK